MNRKSGYLWIIAVSIFAVSCASTQSDSNDASIAAAVDAVPDVTPGIEEVIPALSLEVLRVVPAGTQKSLAVYYFTTGDEESELSDYIVNNLTTALANSGSVKVLSRQALDRIMSEYSYQLTDLVDAEEQVAIGKQLGADLIVTGFVTPLSDEYEINIQVLDVESARVLGGAVMPFLLPDGFEMSLTVQAGGRYTEIEGVGTRTVIYEDFEAGYTEMPMSHEEEHWGERIVSTYGVTEIRSSEERGSFAQYDFTAEFDHVNLLDRWRDSDAGFYFRLDTDMNPEDRDGIAFSLKLDNVAAAHLSLRQFIGDELVSFWLPIQVNPGEWKDFKIPFGLFTGEPETGGLDSGKPVQIEVYASFEENYRHFLFREGTKITGSMSIDDVGFFSRTGADPENLVAGFEDEIDRAAFSAELYGSSLYEDYTFDDGGVPAENNSVKNQTIKFSILPDGPAGSYRHIDFSLEMNDEGEDNEEMQLLVRVAVAGNFDAYNTLTFFARSNAASEGSLEIQDYQNDEYFWSDFNLSGSWSRIRLNLQEMGIYGYPGLSENLLLYFSFDLTPEMRARVRQGNTIPIDLSFDDIVLENR